MNTDVKYINDLVSCYQKKCKKYQKKMADERSKLFIISNKLFEDYNNKKITKKEFLKLGKESEKKYLNSVGHLDHVKCSLDKCYDLTKAKLDVMAKKINYDIKNDVKYDVNYHNKILLLNYLHQTKDFLKK
jgi:hypothetical protein